MSAEMIPATEGWRVVLIDREGGEGAIALPIVAWRIENGGEMLVPVYVPYEEGVMPLLLKREAEEDLVGFLAPDDELELSWHQVADEARKRLDEAEERAHRASSRESAS